MFSSISMVMETRIDLIHFTFFFMHTNRKKNRIKRRKRAIFGFSSRWLIDVKQSSTIIITKMHSHVCTHASSNFTAELSVCVYEYMLSQVKSYHMTIISYIDMAHGARAPAKECRIR